MFKIYNNFIIPRKLKKSILLIGNFDGLHLGHQKVCNEAKKYKKKYKLKLGVLTFNPLPVMFFNNKMKNYRLTNDSQKFILLKKMGVDFVINKRFNLKFSKIKSEKFIKNIIVKKIDPKFIFVSNNFRYGNKRKGDVKELITESKKYGFNVIKPEPLRIKKKIVSSTSIRDLLKKGKIKKANKLLSRNWVINGDVQRGRQLGKKLGFPTCNIDINNYILTKPGVYSVKVTIDESKKILNGIAYLGYRPTFEGKKLLLEVNLFGFNGNLYKKTLNVYFFNFIRRDKKFKNKISLITQMKKDLTKAKLDLKKKIIL
ncbi:MAG: bifunctional riboflavin kinase/FAD synthetase [Pelagibacteraceae bacterium]|nr:bifunctional riboflavin kinase/FAD synthetase [Pelagibacteraceae bacterium]